MPLLELKPEPKQRTIGAIATEIYNDWTPDKIKYSAKPYLEAMRYLRDQNSSYGADSASSVVAYFLSNAASYRTPKAAGLKAELKKHFPGMK